MGPFPFHWPLGLTTALDMAGQPVILMSPLEQLLRRPVRPPKNAGPEPLGYRHLMPRSDQLEARQDLIGAITMQALRGTVLTVTRSSSLDGCAAWLAGVSSRSRALSGAKMCSLDKGTGTKKQHTLPAATYDYLSA
jgi:hypothetical protein